MPHVSRSETEAVATTPTIPTLSCMYRQRGPYLPQRMIVDDTAVDGSVWSGLRTYLVEQHADG